MNTNEWYCLYVGHMAQQGKKTLSLFKSLKKELVEEAKKVGHFKVWNMKEPFVEFQVQDGTKRKAMVPVQKRVGKDVKKVRAELLGPGSSTTVKKPKSGSWSLQRQLFARTLK